MLQFTYDVQDNLEYKRSNAVGKAEQLSLKENLYYDTADQIAKCTGNEIELDFQALTRGQRCLDWFI